MTKQDTAGPDGPLWLLFCLAILPFAAKVLVVASGRTGYLVQSTYKALQAAAPIGWRRRFGHRGLDCLWPVREPLPAASTWALAVLVAAALAGAAIAAVSVAAGRLGIDPAVLKTQYDAKFSLTPLKAAGIVAYLFTLNAALEELHFRAWLDREIAARFGHPAGIAVSASAFAAMHLGIFAGMEGATPIVLGLVFIGLLIAGVSWSLIARRPGGIHAAWLSHGLTDAGLLTWGLFWLGYFKA